MGRDPRAAAGCPPRFCPSVRGEFQNATAAITNNSTTASTGSAPATGVRASKRDGRFLKRHAILYSRVISPTSATGVR
ncbi:MAG TPA: hypothetical protein VNL35_23200 [Chloroflexota bacterium]|nr:hypothetical protein [Chloroflexota bacterium]